MWKWPLAMLYGMAAMRGALAAPNDAPWVVEAELPGADLPIRGQALFDTLRADPGGSTGAQPVPFPFTALLARLREWVPTADDTSPYAAVLIPIGRSLQRHAAAPNYFRYPRVVVAVISEASKQAAPLLKDRLYFGYQEQAGVLEVISYNEAMGRFEFQIVKDYRPGGTPHVYYAKRAICTACHQNQAPIFARPLWRETNANPAVAARLADQHRGFYGLPISVSIDVPSAIDDAVQRANRLSFGQRLWSAGCALPAQAVACRVTLLNAALQLRLSGDLGYASDETSFGPLRAAWQRHWPHGLSMPNPDIPNRDPLVEVDAVSRREVVVPAALDPLLPRPPLSVLRFDQRGAQDAVVAQLGQFFAAADITALDQALFARGSTAARKTYSATCRCTRSSLQTRVWRLDVRCQNALDSRVTVEGRLYFDGTHLQRAVFDHIALPPDDLDDVSVPAPTSIALDARGITLPLHRGALHARRRNGNALSRLTLQWAPHAEQTVNFTGSLTLEEQDDYAPVRAALQHVAAVPAAGAADGLSALPFQRARIVPALFAQLGIAAPASCCANHRALPAPHLEPFATLDLTQPPTGLASEHAAALQSLQRYCAPCHDSAERFPPNFLSGSLAAVQAKLTQCAARIDYRLNMWTLPAAQRRKTPMPPELALRADQRDPLRWPRSNEYAQLRRYINSLRTTPVAAARDYQQLDACLPKGE